MHGVLEMELLGVDVDVADPETVKVAPTEKRITRLEGLLDSYIDREEASVGELDSLAGKLSF